MSHGIPDEPTITQSPVRLYEPAFSGHEILNLGVRKIPPNTRSVTGYYMPRCGNQIQFESYLEYDFYFLIDYDPATRGIIPQCPRIDGHVVDATIVTSTGPCFVDVKYEAELVKKWPKLSGLFSNTYNYAQENKASYAFFTDASRNESRNRLAVLKQIAAKGKIDRLTDDDESSVLSTIKESAKVRTLDKINTHTKSLELKSILCKLIIDGKLVLQETPTQFLDDATVSLKSDAADRPLRFLIPFPRLMKRIETHPLRFINGSEINYYDGMNEIKLEGHKYDVVDGTDPTNALIRSTENDEEYRVPLDIYGAAGGRLTAFAIQQNDPEQYYELIQRINIIKGLAHLRRVPNETLCNAGYRLDISTRQVE